MQHIYYLQMVVSVALSPDAFVAFVIQSFTFFSSVLLAFLSNRSAPLAMSLAIVFLFDSPSLKRAFTTWRHDVRNAG